MDYAPSRYSDSYWRDIPQAAFATGANEVFVGKGITLSAIIFGSLWSVATIRCMHPAVISTVDSNSGPGLIFFFLGSKGSPGIALSDRSLRSNRG